MGLKRYGTDGAWCEVENVRRYAAQGRIRKVDDYTELYVRKDSHMTEGFYAAGIQTENLNLSKDTAMTVEWSKIMIGTTSAITRIEAKQADGSVVYLRDRGEIPPASKITDEFVIPAGAQYVQILQMVNGGAGFADASAELRVYGIRIGGIPIPIEI